MEKFNDEKRFKTNENYENSFKFKTYNYYQREEHFLSLRRNKKINEIIREKYMPIQMENKYLLNESSYMESDEKIKEFNNSDDKVKCLYIK